MKQRVVITGLGIVSAIGLNKNEFYEGLRDNRSGIKPIQRFDTHGYRTNQAAEIQNWNPMPSDQPEGDRCLQFALEAAKQAIDDSGLETNTIEPSKAGVCIATSLGCVDSLQDFIRENVNGNSCSNGRLNIIPHNIPGAKVASKYGFTGPLLSVDTACASGSNSIGYACDVIRNGICDIMLAGGVDILSPLSYSGFSGMMNLTKTLCRPFDKNRSGLVLGEGGAVVILESLAHARKRFAPIYGEVLGYGLSNDSYHETQPDPEATGAVTAMAMALHDAGVPLETVNYINAHGTGTKFNDLMEVRAIRKVFPENTPGLKISSIKAAIGHTLGAAGSLEFLACVLSIRNDFVPATLNFETPMEGYDDLDFIPNQSQDCTVNVAMSNSFGFAGNCCSIILSKLREQV
jgi:3-oxoacyl-[acyl-carrier-protein] synthase II